MAKRKAEVDASEVDQNESTAIDYLPDEVLTEIFRYLRLKDRKAVSLVCKRWYDIASVHSLAIEHPLELTNPYHGISPLPLILKSKRIFPFVRLDLSVLDRDNVAGLLDFFTNYGKNIQKLEVLRYNDVSIAFSEDYFQKLFALCRKIKVLIVDDFETLFEFTHIPDSLETVDICNLPYCYDEAQLHRFLHLKHIIFRMCQKKELDQADVVDLHSSILCFSEEF